MGIIDRKAEHVQELVASSKNIVICISISIIRIVIIRTIYYYPSIISIISSLV